MTLISSNVLCWLAVFEQKFCALAFLVPSKLYPIAIIAGGIWFVVTYLSVSQVDNDGNKGYY